jgi:hypothetical protein
MKTPLQIDIDSLRDQSDPQSREECARLRNIQRAEEKSWNLLLSWPPLETKA